MAQKKAELNAVLVKERYDAGLRAIRNDLHEYWLNHAFCLGHQWLFYNPETRRLDELPRDPDRVQATINRIRSNSRTIIAKLVQRELSFEVLPDGADDATIRGAKTAEAAIRGIHRLHNWEVKREEAAWLVWKGGTVAISVDWNPKLGNFVDLGADGSSVFEGDTEECVLSIAEMVVEPGAPSAETANWWIKAKALPPSQVQAAFNLPTLPKSDITAGMSSFQQKMVATTSKSSGGEMVDLTLVLTYYERPNSLRPEGAVAVLIGDTIVDGPKPWPFPWKDHLNLAVAKETPQEGRWTGDTVLSQARPVQTAMNASWSSIIEHMKLAGNARLYVPQSSMDLIESFSDMPAEIVPYPDGMQTPTWGSPPQMPAWWIEQPKMLANEMDDIMGLHDISRGDAPTNIQSGYGLSVLAEQDNTPVGRLSKEMAIMFSKVGTMCLKLYEKEVTETRKSAIKTPGEPTETARWTGKDLQGQTNAEVPLEAILPRSRAAMMALADKAMQMGLITTMAEYAKVAELPGQHDLIEALNPDVARARRENANMAMGSPELPMEIDDHTVHIREHHNDMKSLRFSMLSEQDKQVYYDHVQAHETMAAQEAARQLAKTMVNPVLGTIPDRNGAPSIPPELAAQMAPPPGLPAAPPAPA